MKNSNSTTKVVGALVLGAAAGATLGVLFAPKKGSETRQEIADNAKKVSKNLKDKLQSQVDDLKNQVAKAEKFIDDNVSNARSSVEDRVASTKSNFEHKIGHAAEASKS